MIFFTVRLKVAKKLAKEVDLKEVQQNINLIKTPKGMCFNQGIISSNFLSLAFLIFQQDTIFPFPFLEVNLLQFTKTKTLGFLDRIHSNHIVVKLRSFMYPVDIFDT